MKIPKENMFVIIIGVFLFSYLLETIVKPIKIHLSSPYEFLSPLYFTKFPFTSVVVVIRAISLFMAPLFLVSFIPRRYYTKVGLLFIISFLSQLLSLQEVVSDNTVIPLEWALSLSIAGAALVIPMVIFTLQGLFVSAKERLKQENQLIESIEYDEE